MVPVPAVVLLGLVAFGLSLIAWHIHDRIRPGLVPARRPWLHRLKLSIYTALPVVGLLQAFPLLLDTFSEDVWATGRVVETTMIGTNPVVFRLEVQSGEFRTEVRVPDEVAHRLESGDMVEIAMQPRTHRVRSVTILQGTHRGYQWNNSGSGIGDFVRALLALVWLPIVLLFWGAFVMELAIPGLAELGQAWWRRARKAGA